MNQRLAEIASKWKEEARVYFSLAEKEDDPMGRKFYESSAVARINCIEDLERVTDLKVLNQPLS